MKSSYILFCNSLDNVISALEYTIHKINTFEIAIENVANGKDADKLLDGLMSVFHSSGPTEYSKFIYNGSIVSVYGALERLIENIIEAYVFNVNSLISDYDNLNGAIKKNHIEFSFNLAARVTRDRNLESFQKLKKQREIIDNLQSCFNNSNYTLNKNAFSVHTANFRFDIIRESFSNIGLKDLLSSIIKNSTSIRNSLASELGLSESEVVDSSQLENVLKDKLDQLAIRRNEIAHGALPESYLNYELLLQFARLISDFGTSIYNYCQDSIDNLRLENMNFEREGYIGLGKPKKLFEKINVIGFEVDKVESINDKKIKCQFDIYFVNRDSNVKVIKSSIISMKVNDVFVHEYTIFEPFSMGIRLREDISKDYLNREVYIRAD